MSDPDSDITRDANLRWAVQQLEDSLRSLRFGSVTLIIQDGVVVQVDRTDRRRYQRGNGDRPAAVP
jgi:hypothetical protein